MTKNLYYRTALRRRNTLKEGIFDLFLALCSLPRMTLEVFIKRNFGERYFGSGAAIFNIVLLLLFPIPIYQLNQMVIRAMSEGYGYTSGNYFMKHYLTWYLFILVFAYFAYLRRKEIKRQPSVFDFAKFSLYNGDLLPQVAAFFKFRSSDIRRREIFYEPLIFFVIGIILIFLSQALGWLLVLCSLFYSISYAAAYHNGDNFVMDTIDEMIMNEEKERSFVDGKDPSETRGVRYFARRPTAEDLKRKVADAMVEDDDEDIEEAR